MPRPNRVAAQQKPRFPAATVTAESALREVVEVYSGFDHFAFDVETIAGRAPRTTRGNPKADKPALDERTNNVIWISLAGPGRVDVIPLGHPTGPPQLDKQHVLQTLRPLFFSDRIKINHNVRFDVLSLSKYWGALPPGPFHDTNGITHLLNENCPSYRLGDLIAKYFGYSYPKLAKDGVPMDTFDFDDVASYVGRDAKLAHLLYQRMSRILANPDFSRLRDLYQLECRILEVLLWMKQRGALVDRQAFDELDESLGLKLDELKERIYEAAGTTFLLNSPQQVGNLLYDTLGLPCKMRTDKDARSVSKDALKLIAGKHPVVPLLLERNEYAKLRSTYTSGFYPHIADDGRIRTGFNPSRAVTGRFTSSAPNLQNLPRQSDPSAEGIRRMFIAPPGYVLVVGDYSMIEARIMAHYAAPLVKESKLLHAFIDGIDLHTMTAAGLFAKPLEEITSTERSAGKMANFLLMFGGYSDLLRDKGGYSDAVAKSMFTKFHATYPEIDRYRNFVISRCKKMPRPYVESILGRRRRLPHINTPGQTSAAWRIRSHNERQALNHTIQGSAADINKLAMVRTHDMIGDAGLRGIAHVILTVHDEIVLEVPEELADQGVELLRSAMEGLDLGLRVPLLATIHSGKNWAEAK